MKDLTISAKWQKHELAYLLIAFIFANVFNVAAIITYSSPATEVITSMFYVLTLTAVLYVAWTVLRLIVWGIKKLFKPKKI